MFTMDKNGKWKFERLVESERLLDAVRVLRYDTALESEQQIYLEWLVRRELANMKGVVALVEEQLRKVDCGKGSAVPDMDLSNAPIPMVWVASGNFEMGSNDGEPDEKPVHTVRLMRGYWLGKYPVTQGEYEALMGNNPSRFTGVCNPVEQVSWDDAVALCRKLTERERATGRLPAGYEYRLPTEAEWEYAARGGAQSKGYTYSGSNAVGDVAWYVDNSDRKTHEVGGKRANELGIYDMSGTVWEWCSDRYGEYAAGAVTDPQGAEAGESRVRRGGCWSNSSQYCSAAYRGGSTPGMRDYGIGFRLAAAPV